MKNLRKVFDQKNDIDWADFKNHIAEILNIFPDRLCAQYILSTESASTIPITLATPDDLAELHTRLGPLVTPPRNADGSRSKRKPKLIIVKVTDKNDNPTSSTSNGKVLYVICVFMIVH